MGRHRSIETIRNLNRTASYGRGRRPAIDWNDENLDLLQEMILAGASNYDIEIKFGSGITTILCGCRILVQELAQRLNDADAKTP